MNYQAGIFNGNGVIQNNNDSGNFLYAGRIALFPKLFDNKKNVSLEIGVNAAFSKDSSANIVGGIIPAFSGKRVLIGPDFRFLL